MTVAGGSDVSRELGGNAYFPAPDYKQQFLLPVDRGQTLLPVSDSVTGLLLIISSSHGAPGAGEPAHAQQPPVRHQSEGVTDSSRALALIPLCLHYVAHAAKPHSPRSVSSSLSQHFHEHFFPLSPGQKETNASFSRAIIPVRQAQAVAVN